VTAAVEKLSEHGQPARTLLVVSAHSADFVWRAAGAIATVTAAGGTAAVVSLSYGERGESGELWKEPGQTVERVKEIRHREAETAAEILGASFRCLDLGDYPLVVDRAAVDSLTALICETKPDILLAHAERDPFNPDHPAACEAAVLARQLASGAGVASAFETIPPPELLLFEPHQPELCGFVPTTFLDITPVYERKRGAMAAMGAQQYLRQYYTERAEQRANHARRISGSTDIRYAEAFQRTIPQVVTTL
jgi:4-oxalomesaconate hydratase